MIIYLLRHGIAEDIPSDGQRTDDARALTPEGKDKLRKATRAYAKVMQCPDRILASPLIRAQQTAEILAEACGFDDAIEGSKALLYSAKPSDIINKLQVDLLEDIDAIALVGHEPHLGHLAGMLLSSSERMSIPLKRGMLIAIEVREPQIMLGSLLFSLSQKAAGKLA